MEKETEKAYRDLQKLLGPSVASWLDRTIGIVLARTRAVSAASVSWDRTRS